ncbi:MAG: 50S ribosomal protein L17 [Candidatus Sungbacteria bacterium]|nr:50S ribosomal protein L17 [Candidatus Sungbacteria bacterium]
MRKLKKGRKFGRERDQRRALLKSLASSFFIAGRMKTTEAKAKELRPYVEKFITRAKDPTLANRRFMLRFFSSAIVDKIIKRGEEMRERAGGYTRVIKLGQRKRDSARMAILEFV